MRADTSPCRRRSDPRSRLASVLALFVARVLLIAAQVIFGPIFSYAAAPMFIVLVLIAFTFRPHKAP